MSYVKNFFTRYVQNFLLQSDTGIMHPFRTQNSRPSCTAAFAGCRPKFCLIALAMIALGAAACGPDPVREPADDLTGDSWQQTLQHGHGSLIILFVPSGGFAYSDEHGRLTGATIEILREFGHWVEKTYEVDLELNFKEEENWQRFYRRVTTAGDGVIGTGNVTITEARREELQFSPPYLDNIAVLVSHEERPELSALTDIPRVFAGRTGLLHLGTLHSGRMEQLRKNYFPEMPLDTVRSNGEIMERMASGDYYFTYLDVHNYVQGLNEGIPMKRHPAGDDSDEQFGFIMPLDSDWIEPMEAFFEHDGGFVESETYREIIHDHLGKGMTDVLNL